MTTGLDPGVAGAVEGPRVIAPIEPRLCDVVATESYGPYRVFGLADPQGPTPLAGQFYMLATEHGWGSDAGGERPYLPRALSVCRVRGDTLDFMIEDVGPGTGRLCRLRRGERVRVLGPLGIGFVEPSQLGAETAVLVGGGVGTAPLVIWAEQLREAGAPMSVMLGYRDAAHAQGAGLLPGEVGLATDDGSRGHHGFVTDLLERQLDSDAAASVYACGPPGMLESVRKICAERDVRAQLALEAGMACGFGACFGCVVRTRDGYRRLCVDGPVVAAHELHEDWQ